MLIQRTNPTLALLFVMMALTGQGCRRVPPAESATSSKTGRAGSLDTNSVDDDATRFLSSVVNLLKGDIDAGTYTSAVIQLNKFVQRRPGAIPDLSTDARAQVTRVLGTGNVATAQRKTFAEDDIEFLRNAFFLRQIARRIYTGSGSNVDRAIPLFDWTCDEISLTTPGQYRPVPPAETLLRGYGEPQERMAVFLELLRQTDLLGGVLAVTTQEDPQGLVPWLVGLFDGGEMYLFDPVLGRPVPSPTDPHQPAKLSELAANPTLATRRYPAGSSVVDPAKIDRFAILLPTDACQLAPRMQFLQSKLLGDDRVNLFQDLAGSVDQASAAIRPISNQAGVQIWRFPEETSRAFLAYKRTLPEGLVGWQQIRYRPRLADLEGRPGDAIKEVVSLDLNPLDPVVWDLSLQWTKLPLEESRRIIAHTIGSVAFVGACAQRTSHPNDPSYSDEWLTRYLTRSLNPLIQKRDLFEIPVLGKQLAGHPIRTRQPLEERLFELLPASSQKLARLASDVTERASIVPAPAAEASPTVQIPESLNDGDLSELITRINELLGRADLIGPELAQPLWKDLPARVLPAVLQKDPASLTPEEVRWRNRLLFDRVFSESVLPADRPWLAGVLRLRAENLVAQGKTDEALALLDADYPLLPPLAAASLKAESARLREK
jgi:hypothetical protein